MLVKNTFRSQFGSLQEVSYLFVAILYLTFFWTFTAQAQSVAALNASPNNPNLRYYCEAETSLIRKGSAAQTEVSNISRELKRLSRKIGKKRAKLSGASRARKRALRAAIRDHRAARRGIKDCRDDMIRTPCGALEDTQMGTASTLFSPRIINGNGLCAQENTPFITVLLQPEEEPSIRCLGTIIQKDDSNTSVIIPASCLGGISAFDQVSAQFADMFVLASNITLHPNFQQLVEGGLVVRSYYDIAIVKFAVSTTQPIAKITGELHPKLPLYIQGGLGITEEDQTESDYLLRAGFATIQEEHDFEESELVTKRTPFGSSLCTDDWGGPLIARTADDSWRVLGIFASYSYTDVAECTADTLSIFTKLDDPLISSFLASVGS